MGKIHKFMALSATPVFLFFSGCSSSSVQSNADIKATGSGSVDVGYQLELPEEGEDIAVIKTNMGTMKLRLFEKEAPKACENFKTLAKDGFYNGIIFHRVIKNFMIQTGDPNGDGTGGKSIWDKPFEDEFSDHLFNITYSVAMANRGKNTNESQFFINQGDKDSFIGFDRFSKAYEAYKKDPEAFTNEYGSIIDMSKFNDRIKDLYNENGGNPHLDGFYSTTGNGHTVFAQVYDGKDVVDSIASVKTNGSDRPIKDIIIKKVDIVKYKK